VDRAWKILRTALAGYVAHDDISRGAAIAFYAVTSLAPVLLIITAIAGLAFGEDSVRAAISSELNDLLGGQGADLVKSLLASSTDPAAGTTATLVGIVVLVATASGVFGEMQTALNTIWNVRTSGQPFYSLIRTRAASLGLVAALGFLMIVSLAASTALSAIGHYLSEAFPLAQLLLATLNTLVSLALHPALRSHLQHAAGCPYRVARCRNRRLRHRGAVYSRQIAYRLVPRPRRTKQRLRGGRRPYRTFALDLLLFPDFSIRRRDHQSDRRYGEHVGDNWIDGTFGQLNAKGTPPFSAR
jgi:hypothetical protein